MEITLYCYITEHLYNLSCIFNQNAFFVNIFQTRCNITTILISEIVWEKFRCGTGFVEPYIIHFPDYSKGKLIAYSMLLG